MPSDNGNEDDAETIDDFSDAVEAGLDEISESEEEENESEPEASDASAPDENEENEDTEDADEPSDETDTEDESSEDEDEESEEDPVPYDRFKEVNDEKNELKDRVEDLETQLSQYRHYFETDEGNRQLAQMVQEAGLVETPEPESDDEDNVDDALDTLEQVLPPDAVDELKNWIDAKVGSDRETDEGDDTEMSDAQARRRSVLEQRISRMSESGEYPHIEDVALPRNGQGSESWMDVVFKERPMDYADSTGLPDPDKLDQLYEEAVERADLADTNGSGPDEDNADSDDEVIELTEEELQQERKKAKEELKKKLQQNADDEPVEPSEGHSSTEDAGADGDYTLKEALRESAQEHGLT